MDLVIQLNWGGTLRRRTFWTMEGLNGLIWILIAVLHEPVGWFNYGFGFVGVLFVFTAVMSLVFDETYQLTVDELGMHGRIRWRGHIDLRWEDISSAELGNLNLRLRTVDGKVRRINFGNLMYPDLKELKPKLRTVLANHGLLSEQHMKDQNR